MCCWSRGGSKQHGHGKRSKTFASQRGLSAHQRKHLGVSVSKARVQTARVAKDGGWTQAELATLDRIHDDLGGKFGFLEAAVSALPQYTKAQIQQKWRNLRKLRRKAVVKTPTAVVSGKLPDLRKELPPRAPVALVKEHLAKTLQAHSVDGVSPLTSSCRAINGYLRKVLAKLRRRCHPRIVSMGRTRPVRLVPMALDAMPCSCGTKRARSWPICSTP
ncbi:uncharacterized protein LOC122983164 [Thunnus albacares]|uniref:uncharacterized protein LOC122983164 n=1 Tax=Thunnus albacares TaxID=8236 RepID=UPI001CF716BB|nr:uncharacterized protein LOC122983164 [Thunnus albacares]